MEDENLMMSDKHLDSEWKRIQQKTFTRWCNEHLKCVNMHIAHLNQDLGDGVRLIALLQVLSQKDFPRYVRKPRIHAQRLENVELALKFIQDQGIRMVNMGAGDIVSGNLKLILGMIWTLILHYCISTATWEDEGELDKDADRQKTLTPKEKLWRWILNKMPDSPITNFTTDWNDGRTIGALVDACAPGLCADWKDWDPNDSMKNTQNAMQLADDWLDVPQVLGPEDMCNPNVDELSMMTYLSKFPKCKLKPGAPLRSGSTALQQDK